MTDSKEKEAGIGEGEMGENQGDRRVTNSKGGGRAATMTPHGKPERRRGGVTKTKEGRGGRGEQRKHR